MIGGAGNDIHVVDSLGGIVTEFASGGNDTIRTSLTDYSLAAAANVSNLTFTGTGSFTGTGNGLANSIAGSTGNDTLDGGSGNDTLLGGLVRDRLVGGLNTDVMTGGGGGDIFTFLALVESGNTTCTADHILDFQRGLDDIDVSVIDANASRAGNQALTFVGAVAFTAAGQIRSLVNTGDTFLAFNTVGNLSTVEMMIHVEGTPLLGTGDFLL